ncbi:AraC family transcriptional regulator [Pendulispora rubella]|uniref:AraC family transcriptional regulator n=1 Tax=Pendulispora rubella TaxID=2741070 RepID=A0ABZ2KPA2_9BACT
MATSKPRGPIPVEMLQLAERLFQRTPKAQGAGLQFVSPLRGLRLLKHHARTNFEAGIYEPVICLILQGRKETTFGERTFRLGSGECLLVSHDVPVVSRIVEAPYMALLLDVQIDTLRGLYDELGDSPGDGTDARALEVHTATPRMLGALGRYLELAESPTDAKVLGPMISKEIHYRLLMDPVGGMLRTLIRYDSHAALVSRAIALIRRDFRSSIVIAELARDVGMSVSSFHRHFKAVTALSPLQYQKELRLLEAKRMLVAGAGSVSTTAFDVGYESLSQFSREYSRKFGKSPNNDLVGSR